MLIGCAVIKSCTKERRPIISALETKNDTMGKASKFRLVSANQCLESGSDKSRHEYRVQMPETVKLQVKIWLAPP